MRNCCGCRGTVVGGDAQHLPPWTWHPMAGKEVLWAGVGRGVLLGVGLSMGLRLHPARDATL